MLWYSLLFCHLWNNTDVGAVIVLNSTLTQLLWCHSFQQSDDKSFRRSPSWRKRFRPRDGQGLGMMPGSIETLPAGLRFNTMSIPPSMASVPKKQLQPEGKKGGQSVLQGWSEFIIAISTLLFNGCSTVLTSSAFSNSFTVYLAALIAKHECIWLWTHVLKVTNMAQVRVIQLVTACFLPSVSLWFSSRSPGPAETRPLSCQDLLLLTCFY